MRVMTTYIPAAMFVGVCVLLYVWDAPVMYLNSFIEGGGSILTSYVVYTLLLVGAVVFMPVTVMPLIPMSAAIIGPFMTGVLSVIGWTVGGGIAFLIARHLGRPVVLRFVSLEELDNTVARIPQNTRFLAMVLLRLTLPVDLVSYALGLSRSIGFWEYMLATVIGVTWFSFAFAYIGEALFEQNTSLLLGVGAVSLVVFGFGWYALQRTRNK
jgi:uncharacterized membrane protein YdjX (TVP38/TMEM64 family)